MIMCRICLSSSTEMDITKLEFDVDDTTKTCVDIFNFCLNIMINADMDRFTKLCSSCFYNLVSFYEFKCLALKSDAYLKTTYNQYEMKKSSSSENLKLEDIDFDDNEYLDGDPDAAAQNVESDSNTDIPDSLANEMIDVVPLKKENIAKPNKRIKIRDLTNVKTEPTTTRARNGTRRVFHNNIKVLDLHTQKVPKSRKQKEYECNDCRKMFFSYKAMKCHYQTDHFGLKDSAEKRNACKIKTEQDSHMLAHTRRLHVCEICGKSYTTKYKLKMHHQQNHERIERFSCAHCPKKYYSREPLAYHLKTQHSTIHQSHVCPDCGKSFKLWKSFKIHLHSHRTTKAYVCTICTDRAFKTQGCLYAHMLIHRERRHTCPHCGVKFTRKGHLNRHLKAKHGGVTVKTEKPLTTKDEKLLILP